jgi:uncharacterized protein (TIGR02996 family)
VSDEAGLLDAIVREPDDDLHRLVYADLLEERGQDARAEFIRVQIELAQPASDWERRVELLRREKTLLARNSRRWAKPFHPRLTKLGFRRGFVERASADAGVFLSSPDELLSCAPIHHLALRDARPHAGALAGCRQLGWLEGISVPSLGVEALLALLSSPHLEGLCSLDLTGNGLDNQALGRLLEGRFPSLRVLYLDGNDLDGPGLRATLESVASRLEVLSVVRNDLGAGDLEPLLLVLPWLRTLYTDCPASRPWQQSLRANNPNITFHFTWRTEWEA